MSDKKHWIVHKFSDIAENIVERVMPCAGDEATYIGLEHMESGSLHIKTWGSKTTLIGEKVRIKQGDVLFAKRNAYLKRAAIAPFDGIFSAHGMVFRPKTEIVTQEFFPFFIFSDIFMERAIKISVGSLSPTVNWTALKKEEFALPPIQEQKKIAEVLWAADEALATYRTVRVRTQQLQQAFINKWVDAHSTKFYKFSDIWKQSPESGCSASEVARETGHYVLSLSAISEKGYKPGERKCVERTSKMEKAILSKGDLLISRSNTMELVGLSVIYSDDTNNVSFPDTMMRISINESEAIKEYIATLFNAAYGRQWMRKICAGTSHSMKKINRKSLGEVPIPSVEKIQQINFLNKCKNLDDTIEMCTKKINILQSMLFALIDHYLGGATNV